MSHATRASRSARCLVLLGCAVTASHAATFNGTVFEDANYGGGAGRSRTAAGGTVLPGVRVELYRVSSGALVDSDTTDASGNYSLSNGNNSYQVRVRVVNGTVRSARVNGSGCSTCVPVQTYRTDATGGTPVPVTDHVGGENPALSDAIANTTNASYGSLSVGTRTPQSVTMATPGGNGTVINGIDFGFNFDTVVNTRDAANCAAANSSYPCQGSLRQFVINANALGGVASLVQSGSGLIDGSSAFLPSGYESSIFMIPDGNANAGQNTGYASQLTGGVAIVTLAAALTTVTGANVRLDGTTQTVNVGNDNPGTLGTGGTVGVDGITLPTFQRPEVQLTAGDTVVTLGGSNDAILGFALRQGYLSLTGDGCLARNNLVGMTATGISSDNSAAAYGISFTGTNATVRNNFVTVNNSGIRTDNGGTGSLVTLNEVARPTFGHTNTFDGILLVGTVSSIQVTANLARDQEGGGIEVGHGGGTATNITVSNNTVKGNGFTTAGGSTASTEPIGMDAYSVTGTGLVFSRNLVTGNAGPGILVIQATGVTLTQNSFSSNGGLSIDLDPRSLDPNNLGAPQGVTLNDTGDADAGPNNLRNYPVITSAVLTNGELSFAGFARPGSAIELYLAQPDPSGFGEGLSYLGTFTEGSAADLDATTGTFGPGNINGLAQGTDTTNKFSFRITAPVSVSLGTTLSSTATLSGETSEFGGNVVVSAGPTLQVRKVVQTMSDPIQGTTNPKAIPGALTKYTVRVTNAGGGTVDNNTVIVTDPIPANTKMYIGDIGAAGSGPVGFLNGSPSSALTFTFTALNSTTDDLDFSSDGGLTWTYVPTADAQGCDAAITHIRMKPKGTMAAQGAGSPSFELSFQVVVK